MSNDEHIKDLIPAYALGVLDRNEAREVEAHLPYCADCRQELHQMEMVVQDLPLALVEEKPPEALRTRLQQRIAAPAPSVQQPEASRSAWQELVAVFGRHKALAYSQAALIGLVLFLLASTILLWQEVNDLQSAPQPGTLQALQLESTGIVPTAQGYLTVSWDGLSGALILDRMPQLDENQSYQLWLVQNGVRVSGALLDVDELGYSGSRVNAPQSLFNYSSAELTIEPAEGSEQPTSEVILRGDLFHMNDS